MNGNCQIIPFLANFSVTQLYKKSPANAKGNVQQQRMFESPVRTKSKLTDPSNDVSFTLARGHDWSRSAVLAEDRKFSLPPVI